MNGSNNKEPVGLSAVALVICASILFIFGVCLAILGNVTGSTVLFTVFIVLLIFLFLSKFKKFKAFGIEGELWEQEMEEAKKLTEELRELSYLVTKPIGMVVPRTGRYNSAFQINERYEIMKEIKEWLERNGVDEEKITDVMKESYYYTCFDMTVDLRKEIDRLLIRSVSNSNTALEKVRNLGAENEEYKEASEYSKLCSKERNNATKSILDSGFNIEKIMQVIKNSKVLSKEQKEKLLTAYDEDLKDLSHFQQTGTIRRPDRWSV